MSPTWATDLLPPWLIALWANEQTRLALGLLAAGVVFSVVTRGSAKKTAAGKEPERPLRVRRQPWYRRFNLWRRALGRQPWYWKIGKHWANLNHTHGLAVGGSGSGKSTLVVALILQPTRGLLMWAMRRAGFWKRRPVLIISFDRSDPIEEATNVLEDRGVQVERWRVRQSNGWDMLQGDIESIAEALPDGWAKGQNDTGFFRQLCSDSIAAALREQDDEGVPRNMDDMIERMDRIMADDAEIPELARRTWVRRFRSLARVMGESIGQDFDLVSALKAGKVVHLSSNSYTNPALTPLVGAMALTHAKLAAEQVSDVYLVLEEAGFLKGRTAVLDDLSRSMRARGWRIVYLSQDPNDVGNILQVNFGVAVFMGLGPLAQKARQWCADVVKGFPGAFRPEELVLGATIDQLEGYVLLNGRCRDVSLPPYITKAAEHRAARPYRGESVQKEKGRDDAVGAKSRPRYVIEELGQEVRGVYPALPPPSGVMATYVEKTFRENGCLRWKGRHDVDGYGYIWLADEEKSVLVHRWRWEQAYGPIGRDPVTGKKLTIDHRRLCARDCSDLMHLELATRGENSRRRWRTRGVGAQVK